jgi:hypothetical protein
VTQVPQGKCCPVCVGEFKIGDEVLGLSSHLSWLIYMFVLTTWDCSLFSMKFLVLGFDSVNVYEDCSWHWMCKQFTGIFSFAYDKSWLNRWVDVRGWIFSEQPITFADRTLFLHKVWLCKSFQFLVWIFRSKYLKNWIIC